MTASRKRPGPPALIDPNQRYSLSEAAAILRQSMSQLYLDMREGRLEAYREGKRTYVHGAALIKRAAPPAARPAQ